MKRRVSAPRSRPAGSASVAAPEHVKDSQQENGGTDRHFDGAQAISARDGPGGGLSGVGLARCFPAPFYLASMAAATRRRVP
jgi:hypothetical protein